MAIVERHVDSKIAGSTATFFLNKTNDERYCRLVGGLSWPGLSPGFVVIVAEDLKMDETLNERHLRILAEYESHNPSELIRRCKEYQVSYSVGQFFGDTENEAMMDVMQRSGGLSLYLQAAPYVDAPDAFSNYLLMIRELTIPAKKILHFGQKSCLPALLSPLDPKDTPPTAKTAFQKFPAITALGFAVAGLQTTVFDPHEELLINQLENELAEMHGED